MTDRPVIYLSNTGLGGRPLPPRKTYPVPDRTFRARRVPIEFGKRCCATGCGDKIKGFDASDTCVEATDIATGEVLYIEDGCIENFEKGHEDYGHPIGMLIWP